MQKINILCIVVAHFRTLRDEADHFLWSDVGVFFGVPLVAGVILAFANATISRDAFGQSITAFSIFAALLLSVQVALYSVSLRPLTPPDDPRKKKVFEEITRTRFGLIRDLNDNVSYLILLSVCSVTIFLAAFVEEWTGPLVSGISFVIYLHFFFTLLMVVKRASIIFSRAYEPA